MTQVAVSSLGDSARHLNVEPALAIIEHAQSGKAGCWRGIVSPNQPALFWKTN